VQKVASQGSLSLSPTNDNRRPQSNQPKITTSEVEEDKENKLIKEYLNYSINLDASSGNEVS